MKYRLKRITSLVLSLAMLLSLFSVTSFATGTYTDLGYAYVEIGTYTTESLEAGDGVTIPLSIVGLKSGEYVNGVEMLISLGKGLEFDENTPITKLNNASDWALSLVTETGILLGADTNAYFGTKIPSFTSDGKFGSVNCKVTDAYDGSNATISISDVIISQEADVHLNSTNKADLSTTDEEAVIFEKDGTVVGSSAVSPIIITGTSGTEPENHGDGNYRIEAVADKTEAVAGEDVTVDVILHGGTYVGAAVKLSYEADKLTLKAEPGNGWDETGASNIWAHYKTSEYGFNNDNNNDYIIGTFVFTVKALSAETTTVVSLNESYVADTYESGWSPEPAEEVSNTDATITIKQGTIDLDDITEPSNNTFTYNGGFQKSNKVTVQEGETVKYSESENGTYTNDVPEYKNADTYTIYYEVTKPGYTPVYGSYTMVIDPKDATITAVDKNKAYGTTDPELAYTVTGTVEGETLNVEKISRVEGENVGTYDITVTLGENPNYNVTNNSGTFEITAATLDGVVVEAADKVTYDGDPHQAVKDPQNLPDDATIKYSYSTDGGTTWVELESGEVPEVTDAGTYEVKYQITGANYVEKTETVTFVIDKADLNLEDITVTAANEVTYDGKDHAAVAAPTLPDGAAIEYSTNGTDWSEEVPVFKDAGEHEVQYKVTKPNYNDVPGTVTFTINKKAVTITVNNQTISQYDELPTFDGTITGVVDGEDLNVVYSCDADGNTTGGYTITAIYDDNANYDVTVTDGTLTVNDPVYYVEVNTEYVACYDLILVYTNSNAKFSYDGDAMYDVSDADYTCEDGNEYNHVYAIVIYCNMNATKDIHESEHRPKVNVDTALAGTIDYTVKLDVNNSKGVVDLNDAVAVTFVYAANDVYMTAKPEIVLKSDVNNDKIVDFKDFGEIKAEYLK